VRCRSLEVKAALDASLAAYRSAAGGADALEYEDEAATQARLRKLSEITSDDDEPDEKSAVAGVAAGTAAGSGGGGGEGNKAAADPLAALHDDMRSVRHRCSHHCVHSRWLNN
jgi:hypothetical protein